MEKENDGQLNPRIDDFNDSYELPIVNISTPPARQGYRKRKLDFALNISPTIPMRKNIAKPIKFGLDTAECESIISGKHNDNFNDSCKLPVVNLSENSLFSTPPASYQRKPIKFGLDAAECESIISGKYKAGTAFKRYYVNGLKKNKRSGIPDFLFSDDEIIEVYHNLPFEGNEELANIFWSKKIEHKGKNITLYNQGALQSCSYTCVYCAIKNHKENFEESRYRDYILRNSILNAAERSKLLKEHGIGHELVLRKGLVSKEALDDLVSEYKENLITVSGIIESHNVIEYLKENQANYSFALFTIDDKKIDSHAIIFLSVEDDGVIIFDPLHGWVIKIKKEAFMLRANKKYVQDLIWIKNQQ